MITVHNEMNVAYWSSQVLPRKIVDRQVLKSCSFFRTALKDFFSHLHWRRRIIGFEGSDNNVINIYVFTGEAAEDQKIEGSKRVIASEILCLLQNTVHIDAVHFCIKVEVDIYVIPSRTRYWIDLCEDLGFIVICSDSKSPAPPPMYTWEQG